MNMPAPTPKRSSLQSPMGAMHSRGGLARPARSLQPITTAFVPQYREDEPTRLQAHQVSMLRNHLRNEVGPLSCAPLQLFLNVFFSDDLMIESYFQPHALIDQVGTAFKACGMPLRAIPWVEAKRAALVARRAPNLSPLERSFVYAAAFVMPAGLFNLSHPYRTSQGFELSDLWQARNATTLLAEAALQAMRRRHPALGWTMGALLGYSDGEDCDGEQLARMGAALHLSQLRVNELWIPASGWGHGE